MPYGNGYNGLVTIQGEKTRVLRTSFAAFFAVLAVTPVVGLANSITVPLIDKGADTYYVDVHVAGFGRNDYLVDAGAGGAGSVIA
jgi:hypothetical protein